MSVEVKVISIIPKLKRDVARNARSVVARSTNNIFKASQVRVPVDTSELKQSGKVRIDVTNIEGEVIYDAPHAAFVEFGTGVRGSGSGDPLPPYSYGPSPGMRAQPYLFNSTEEERPKFLNEMGKIIK